MILEHFRGEEGKMLTLDLPTVARRWSFSKRGVRRTTRCAVHCDPLENRHLLSVGQTGAAVNLAVRAAAPGAQVATSPAAAAVASSDSSNVTEFGTPAGVSSAQVANLLNEVAFAPTPVNLSTGTVATTAPLTTNPAINVTGVNLTLTNLSVTWLNPDDTSVASAIIDDQVDSDAYLVPSTTELLEGYLGEKVGTPVTLWNTKGLMVSNPQAPAPPVNPVGRNPVSNRGQSFRSLPDHNPVNSPTPDFSEPPGPAEPAKGPQAQPVPQSGQAQPRDNTRQRAPDGNQIRPQGPVPQPAPKGGQAPPRDTVPQPPPEGKGQQAPPKGAAPDRPVLPPVSDPDADAAPGQPSDTDTSSSFSVIFGTAMMATGGFRLTMRQADRSQGRSVPRWLGSERPARRKRRPTPR
jgi:hypothetical protein